MESGPAHKTRPWLPTVDTSTADRSVAQILDAFAFSLGDGVDVEAVGEHQFMQGGDRQGFDRL